MFRHRSDGVGDDTKLRPFFPGMHQPDRMMCGIDNKNSATVSYINAEANAVLPRDETIAAVETLAFSRALDNSDACSVYLLRGNERHAGQAIFLPNLPVNGIQAGERFRLIARDLDTIDPRSETVNDVGQRAERRELLSRKLTCTHLPEVVRVVLVVWTGCRFPA